MARTEVDAVAFGVTYLGVKDIFSTDTSSPQTTELNAHKRAPTLMKWVNMAAIESGALIGLMTSAAPAGHKRWPAMGGVLALIVTYSQYVYAKKCGLASMEEGTEEYGSVGGESLGRGSLAHHHGNVGSFRGGKFSGAQ